MTDIILYRNRSGVSPLSFSGRVVPIINPTSWSADPLILFEDMISEILDIGVGSDWSDN